VSIANKSNIQIVKNSVVNLLRATERGISVYDGDKWLIVYDDNIKTSVSRFTVAHEFGHIFLGHELKKGYYARTFDKNKPEVEQAADMFAARLLAPACVLHELQALSAEQIAKVCNISISAAVVRSERMQVLEARNKYYLHPLERRVREQFDSFIKENRLSDGSRKDEI
jgi:Zn-dependent peptidase ImmA (M78 family)